MRLKKKKSETTKEPSCCFFVVVEIMNFFNCGLMRKSEKLFKKKEIIIKNL